MPRSSIIILAHGEAEMTGFCINSLLYTVPADTEIILFDNGSSGSDARHIKQLARQAGIKLVRSDRNLGFAAGCNTAATEAQGEDLVFLNNDIEARQGWLEPLLTVLEDDNAGISGSLLLYPGGTVQHAGIGLGLWGLPAHLGRDSSPGNLSLQQDRPVLGVTGACLAVGSELFRQLGGFDEQYFFSYEDADLCLRARLLGLRSIYCRDSVLIHHESATKPEGPAHAARGRAQELFIERWGDVLDRAAGRELIKLEAGGISAVAIFGTGAAGRRMLALLQKLTGIEVICFADSRSEMEGREIEGLAVHHISRLPDGIDAVLGASICVEQLRLEAKKAGIAEMFKTAVIPDLRDEDLL